jgi:hypothetical protein
MSLVITSQAKKEIFQLMRMTKSSIEDSKNTILDLYGVNSQDGLNRL